MVLVVAECRLRLDGRQLRAARGAAPRVQELRKQGCKLLGVGRVRPWVGGKLGKGARFSRRRKKDARACSSSVREGFSSFSAHALSTSKKNNHVCAMIDDDFQLGIPSSTHHISFQSR